MSDRTRTILVLSIPFLIVIAIAANLYPHREGVKRFFFRVKDVVSDTFEIQNQLIAELKAKQIKIRSQNGRLEILVVVDESDPRKDKEIADKTHLFFKDSKFGKTMGKNLKKLTVFVTRGSLSPLDQFNALTNSFQKPYEYVLHE